MFMNLFHALASTAMLSNPEGSRNQMLISCLTACVSTPSILAEIKRIWSSNKCILAVACDTSFLISKSLACWISRSSLLYFPVNVLKTVHVQEAPRIFSQQKSEMGYRSGVLSCKIQNKQFFVFFTIFLNSSTILLVNSINSYSCFNVC